MQGALPVIISLQQCQSDLGRIFPLNIFGESFVFKAAVSENGPSSAYTWVSLSTSNLIHNKKSV